MYPIYCYLTAIWLKCNYFLAQDSTRRGGFYICFLTFRNKRYINHTIILYRINQAIQFCERQTMRFMRYNMPFILSQTLLERVVRHSYYIRIFLVCSTTESLTLHIILWMTDFFTYSVLVLLICKAIHSIPVLKLVSEIVIIIWMSWTECFECCKQWKKSDFLNENTNKIRFLFLNAWKLISIL